MVNEFSVTPEHLDAVSAALVLAQTATSATVGASAAIIAPPPAGGDDVSATAAAAFGGFAAQFGTVIVGGLGNHLAGAQALGPVASDFQVMDASGGAAINARSAEVA